MSGHPFRHNLLNVLDYFDFLSSYAQSNVQRINPPPANWYELTNLPGSELETIGAGVIALITIAMIVAGLWPRKTPPS